ncbi:MAG: chemotaxis protein CheB, partial [Candidatus Latescibacterota bacterium]
MAQKKRKQHSGKGREIPPEIPAEPPPVPKMEAPPAPEEHLKDVHPAEIPVVGIGASAGEALQQFLERTPPDLDVAFVFIIHLAVTQKSGAAEVIQRYTKIPVVLSESGMPVEANHFYVMPPDKQVAIQNGMLQLFEPEDTRGPKHPIDAFFRSLAEDRGERAMGIVFSGTGSDGTLGVQAIKGEGGMVMVQDPASAKYDGMPTSALNAVTP